MGEGDENGVPEHELPVSSNVEQMDVEDGEGGPPPLAKNPVDEQSSFAGPQDIMEPHPIEHAFEEKIEESNIKSGDAENPITEQTVNAVEDAPISNAKNEESDLGSAQVDNGEKLIVATKEEEAETGEQQIVDKNAEEMETDGELVDIKAKEVETGEQIVEAKVEKTENGEQLVDTQAREAQSGENHLQDAPKKEESVGGEYPVLAEFSNRSFILDSQSLEGDGSGTEEEQAAFMKELENFHKDRSLEFKPPKFYGEGLNCLKLWRQVTRLGGYDQVTACKLWRQVGESFNPPKTCTTVSWSFRCFYEKALLEYEKHKIQTGELQIPLSSLAEPISVDNQVRSNQSSGTGRAIRDSAARAMQGWHSQRLLGNGEVGDPIIKDKSSVSLLKRDKQHKNRGLFKRKKASSLERCVKVARPKIAQPQMDTMVVDVGAPADWVKINVRRTKDCFEVYALVPGLLREEVHVQSDPAGRLVISGEPEQLDNPWGVTPFKKIVTLPSRIDPHQTSAVVTLHGQLFVRAPFEQSDM